MYQIRNQISKAMLKVYMRSVCAGMAVRSKLMEKDGAGIVEYGLLAVVGVVLVFLAFNFFSGEMSNTIFPGFTKRVNDIFSVA